MLQNDKINCNGSFRDITMYFVKDPCVNVSILWIIIMYHVKPSCCSTSKIHWDMSNFLAHLKASWNTVAWRCLKAKQEDGSGTAALQSRANWDPLPPTETSEMPVQPWQRLPVTQPAPSPRHAASMARRAGIQAVARRDHTVTLGYPPARRGVRGWGQTGTWRGRGGPPESVTQREPKQCRGVTAGGGGRNPEPHAPPSAGRSLVLPLMKPRSRIQREAASPEPFPTAGCAVRCLLPTRSSVLTAGDHSIKVGKDL